MTFEHYVAADWSVDVKVEDPAYESAGLDQAAALLQEKMYRAIESGLRVGSVLVPLKVEARTLENGARVARAYTKIMQKVD